MTGQELLTVAIGLLNLAVVLVLAFHVRRLGIRPPLPLVVLAIVFAIRAIARLVPPIGEDPDGFDALLDVVLFFVLVMLLASTRRLVTTFAHERDALNRARVDYDDALFRHERTVALSSLERLDHLDTMLDEAERAPDEAARTEAMRRVRTELDELRTDEPRR